MCRKLFNKVGNRSEPMKVTPASTAPVKGVAKPIVAEHLGLDFADKIGPRASNCLHALYCVSEGLEALMNHIPAGVSATPSWTRWSHVVNEGGKRQYTGTHLKNFTLLFLSQAVVFNAYNLLICESLLQRRWQKQTCIRPVLLAPVPFRGDTEGMINNIQANSRVKQFTGLCLRFSIKIG